jgi:hypothetical protein
VLAKCETKLECEKEKQNLVDHSHQLQRVVPFGLPKLSNNLSLNIVGSKEHHVHCKQHVLQWSHQFVENNPECLVFRKFHQGNLVLIALISKLLAFWSVSDFTEIAVVLRKYELGLLVSVFRR